jgi:hypothetical protein
MQTRAEKATKYTFNPFDEQWHSYDCRVVVEKRPFAEGGMRCCLRMFELEDNGDFMPVLRDVPPARAPLSASPLPGTPNLLAMLRSAWRRSSRSSR